MKKFSLWFGSCFLFFFVSSAQIVTFQKTIRNSIVGKGTFGKSVQQTGDGGYIVAGSTDRGVYLLKFDAFGHLPWTKIFKISPDNGPNYINEENVVRQATDGGFIISRLLNKSIDNSYDA